MTLAGAYLAAMEALNAGVQFDRAADLCDEATRRLTNVDAADRAALLVRAANYRGLRESASVGLELLEQALEIYSTLAPSTGYVQALEGQVMLLDQLGRFDDAHRVASAAVEAATQVGVPQLHRRTLALLAWHEAEAGHVARARSHCRRGACPRGPGLRSARGPEDRGYPHRHPAALGW